MNDLEFAHRVSPPIGQPYGEAKRSQRQFPRNTLIAMRSLASLCCDLLGGPEDAWPGNLDEKIRALERARRINHETREQLYQLRKWGNRAAHPEAGLLDVAEQPALGVRALELALALLETVFRHAKAARRCRWYGAYVHTRGPVVADLLHG